MTPTWAESQLKHQQVESNPEVNFRHTEEIIEKATISKDAELVIYLLASTTAFRRDSPW